MCGFLGEISRNKINYESVVTSNKETICRGPDEYKIFLVPQNKFLKPIMSTTFLLALID